MRRRRAAVAVVSVLSLLALLPGASVSAAQTSGGPRLVAGTLRDASGNPAAGRVLVFHDNLRDADRLELLGYAKAGNNGQFTFHLGHNTKVDVARSRNDGYANFAMYGVTADGISTLSFFPASLNAKGTSWASQSQRLDRANLRATMHLPSQDFPDEVAASLDGGTKPTTGGGIVPEVSGDQWLDYCLYTKISTWDAATPVMELHTWYTDLTGVASYGRTNTSDSDISVGVKYSSWSLEGTTHIGNSDEVKVTKTATGQFGAILSSSFRYSKWQFNASNYLICASPPDPFYVVESVRWNGTNMNVMWTDTGQDGRCLGTYNAYKNKMDPRDTFSRSSNRLTTFGWTLSGVGVGWRSTSGSSTKVTFDYTAGTARASYYICGNDDYPAYAHRIFAGS
jgi:hypothetical protein